MNDSKWILKTRSFLGALLVAVPAAFNLFGWSWTEDDTALANEIIDGCFLLVGLVTTAVGRIRAADDARPVTVLPK